MWAPVPGFPCIRADTKHFVLFGKPNPKMNKNFNPAFLVLCRLLAIGIVGKNRK